LSKINQNIHWKRGCKRCDYFGGIR